MRTRNGADWVVEVSEKFPCPVCGFLVFDDPSGSFDICPICGWEDDHVQLTYPGMRGGANGASLAEEQALELTLHPLEIREAGGFARDPEWRPLRAEEIVSPPGEPRSGQDYFRAAIADSPEYYWRVKGTK